MEYLAWYWIITVLFFITTVTLFIILLDMKRDKDSYKMGYEIKVIENQDLLEANGRLSNELTEMEVHEGEAVALKGYPYFEGEKQILESRLEEIKFAEKYPLCEHIKKHCGKFLAFYVNGKILDDFTHQGGIDYAKKHLKQTDWTYIVANDDYEAYDVVKKPSKK
jgi:hypothetical protein